MTESEETNFNNILRKIIKNSLFTERQIEIILHSRNLLDSKFGISRGAYYRQLGQSRNKLVSFYYTVILLRGLGILPDDSDVITRLSEMISVIKDGDVFPEKEQDVIRGIDEAVRRACNV